MAQIYVSCLASYNVGHAHGEWIELDKYTDEESIDDAIKAMLAKSKQPGAEEYAIHDYENFPNLGEHPSLSEIAEVWEAIQEHGEAFGVVYSYTGDLAHAKEIFTEGRYHGGWGSFREFVDQYVEDFWDELPEIAKTYFDFDKYARDLEHDFTSVRDGDTVFVFQA